MFLKVLNRFLIRADSLYSTAFKLEVCYGLMNENRKVPLFCINCTSRVVRNNSTEVLKFDSLA